jgi:hypothetical protein
MSYVTVKSSGNEYDLLEKDTNILIKLEKTENDARDICRKLNLGSGFEGFTPPFFAEKLVHISHYV